MQHQGKTVTVVRDARNGDSGFVANSDQVLIKSEDGTEKVVARSEVTKS